MAHKKCGDDSGPRAVCKTRTPRKENKRPRNHGAPSGGLRQGPHPATNQRRDVFPFVMKQTGRTPQRWKRGALVIIQAVLAVGVLAYIFQDRDRRREVGQAVRHASVTWLAAGVVCYGLVEVLGGLRWYLLLRVLGFRLSWRRATSIFLIGLFLTTFTPGLIGGDAARALYVIQEAPERKADAVLTVATDRLMGSSRSSRWRRWWSSAGTAGWR